MYMYTIYVLYIYGFCAMHMAPVVYVHTMLYIHTAYQCAFFPCGRVCILRISRANGYKPLGDRLDQEQHVVLCYLHTKHMAL